MPARYRDIIPFIMAQIIVRHLEEQVKERLQRRAKRHGRSMEDEAREILRAATKERPRASLKLGSRIAARFASVGLTADLPELRGQSVTAARFKR
jgi:plasmid stability protein